MVLLLEDETSWTIDFQELYSIHRSTEGQDPSEVEILQG